MAKAPIRTASSELLVELIQAFRQREVVPDSVDRCGKCVPTFNSAVPNTEPLHPALSGIQHIWVQTRTKKSGPYVERDKFAAWLGEQISCPPEEALWRFAALISWSKKFPIFGRAELSIWLSTYCRSDHANRIRHCFCTFRHATARGEKRSEGRNLGGHRLSASGRCYHPWCRPADVPSLRFGFVQRRADDS